MTKPLATDRMRNLHTWAYAWRSEDAEGQKDLSRVREANAAEWDAWIAQHDAEVAAKALEDVAEDAFFMLDPEEHNQLAAVTEIQLRTKAAAIRKRAEEA